MSSQKGMHESALWEKQKGLLNDFSVEKESKRMIYQKLLMGKNPYFVSCGQGGYFPNHCHPEIELSYCIEGSYTIIIDGKKHTISRGQLAFIKPMVSHEYLESKEKSPRLTIELGSGFLSEFFSSFQKFDFQTVYSLKQEQNENSGYEQIASLLDEIVVLRGSESESAPLLLRGALYRLAGLMLDFLVMSDGCEAETKKLQNISKINRAIELIHQYYQTPLSIDIVCRECGYSKSSFCKNFKEVTGDTFHNVLNRYRIEIACLYLKESNMSVEAISSETGFSDVKSFCRVFKKEMGQSPGGYRK